MNPPFMSINSRRGSALVLVLWCLLLLGLAVFALVDLVGLAVDHATHNRSMLAAHAMAMSGVALGREPQLLPDDPLLSGDSGNESFRVIIASESARLNLNYLLLTKHREILVNLFTQWGLKLGEAQHAADCLYDWITPGDLPSLHGAKADDYASAGLPQRPTHRPFQSLEEAASVLGMDRVASANPHWRESFTLWSNGPLDLSAAPADRIAALFGVPTDLAQALVRIRNGRDGTAGTLDDAPLSAPVCQSALGLTNAQIASLSNEFTFGSKVRRIVSVGRAGTSTATITAVIQLDPVAPKLFVWSER